MNWKMRVTLIGGVVGLLIGLGAAMLYILTVQGEQKDKDQVTLPPIKPTDVLPIVITGVGLVRTIAGLGQLEQKPKKK